MECLKFDGTSPPNWGDEDPGELFPDPLGTVKLSKLRMLTFSSAIFKLEVIKDLLEAAVNLKEIRGLTSDLLNCSPSTNQRIVRSIKSLDMFCFLACLVGCEYEYECEEREGKEKAGEIFE